MDLCGNSIRLPDLRGMWQLLRTFLQRLLHQWLRRPQPPIYKAAAAGTDLSLPASNTESRLLGESWLLVFSFLTTPELCRAAELQAALRPLATQEDLWKQLCELRWRGKQFMPPDLFRNGDYRGLQLTVAECKSLLRRREVNASLSGMEKSELLQAVHRSNPHVPGVGPEPLPIPSKWKRSYVYAELDRKRPNITQQEVAHFRWQLIYHGRPSSMGYRHFQKNGLFVSPHFGETRWFLEQEGHLFTLEGMAPLQVHREPETWGWVLGASTSTEYHSVEIESTAF